MSDFHKISLDKAEKFIKTKARDLERARFEFIFEKGDKDSVIKQLERYQNEDGGFGHGIEPDFWLPSSSPMATWAAGQILLEIDADKNEPIVRSMINYLANTINIETGMWDSVLPENNDYPHAPWWHWNKGVQENWMFNPSAELAAFLVHWSTDQSKASRTGWSAIAKAIQHLMNKNEMDKHEINNFQQLVKIMKPYTSIFNAKIRYPLKSVFDHVLLLAEKCVDRDVSSWSEGYKPLPLDFIDNPNHPLCERFGSLVKENLDWYINQMSEEGIWDISWNWGSYPEEFKIAKENWKGILAVDRYKQLMAFDCLK